MPILISKAKKTDPKPWALLLSADASRREVQKYLRRGELWLAKEGSDIVGAMVLMETLVGVVEIMNIAIAPEKRSQGIGTRLLKRAKHRAKQLKAQILQVGTGNSSFGQLIFYQRFGFRVVGVSRDFFLKRYRQRYRTNGVLLIDMIRMEMKV